MIFRSTYPKLRQILAQNEEREIMQMIFGAGATDSKPWADGPSQIL